MMPPVMQPYPRVEEPRLNPETLSFDDTARVLDCSTEELLELIARRRLAPVEILGQFVFTRDEVARFIVDRALDREIRRRNRWSGIAAAIVVIAIGVTLVWYARQPNAERRQYWEEQQNSTPEERRILRGEE